MGWTHTQKQTRTELIARRTAPWENDSDEDGKTVHVSGRCLARSARGNVLWTVWETTRTDKTDGAVIEVDRWIGCDLLKREPDYGWGYKDMEESMHPYYYTCPLWYLDLAPKVTCEEWRRKVREYQEAKRRKVAIGDTLVFNGLTIPEVTVVRREGRTLIGSYGGRLYRVPPRHLQHVIEQRHGGTSVQEVRP